MENLKNLITRLDKIGIKIELVGNYPWIYLDRVNGNKVTETLQSEHAFTIAFAPIRVGETQAKFTDLKEIFKIIRKYAKK